MSAPDLLRVLLLGEEDLSHGATLRRLHEGLDRRGGVRTAVRTVKEPNRVEARLIAQVRGWGDADLQPLRWRLRYSLRARGLLAGGVGSADVALVNTQACALAAAGVMRRLPTVLSVDMTERQFAQAEFWRPRGSFTALNDRPLHALEQRAYGAAARVVAWTEWTARSLREDYGVPAERIAVVHFGVDVAGAPSRVASPAAPAGPVQLLFVGNFVRRKGLDTLLEALPHIGHPVELHVVTGDAVEPRPGVVVHRGLGPGSPELHRRFAEADVFVLPTRGDAVPWVVVEALAAGLPVVASDIGAIPELVGDTGTVVPRGDARALAAAIAPLAADPALRAELGRRARLRAQERYDRERQLGRLVEVLRDCAASPASVP